MASNAPAPSTTTTTKPNPLSSFDQISKIVYLHRPSTTTFAPQTPGAPSSPKLILVGGWMGAQAPHLAKYTAKLQALFPASPILLVRSFEYHFRSGTANFPQEIAPAVDIIRAIIGADGGGDGVEVEEPPKKPQMLVLVFSNGGATILRHLYTLMRQTAGGAGGGKAQSGTLPPHVTIFDSAPGNFAYTRSVTAFTLGVVRRALLIRLAVRALAHLMAAFYWLSTVPWGRLGFLERMALAHNTRAGENAAEVARAYVYSREDALVDWRFVEAHAEQARRRGFVVGAVERFVGTAHVAHVRGDEGRYWGVVRTAWERGAGV